MQVTVPRLIKDKHQHFSILFYAQGKRYRVSNGKKFGVDLHPNKEPFERRLIVAQELQLRIHQALVGCLRVRAHAGVGGHPLFKMVFKCGLDN